MAAATSHPSGLQAAVGSVLAAIRPGFEEEYVEPETGYSLDLALPSSRLAIEVDGPSHFLLRDARGELVPNGRTLLKLRLLKAAGWHVLSVPFYEWERLRPGEEQRAYLEQRLERKLRVAGLHEHV